MFSDKLTIEDARSPLTFSLGVALFLKKLEAELLFIHLFIYCCVCLCMSVYVCEGLCVCVRQGEFLFSLKCLLFISISSLRVTITITPIKQNSCYIISKACKTKAKIKKHKQKTLLCLKKSK